MNDWWCDWWNWIGCSCWIKTTTVFMTGSWRKKTRVERDRRAKIERKCPEELEERNQTLREDDRTCKSWIDWNVYEKCLSRKVCTNDILLIKRGLYTDVITFILFNQLDKSIINCIFCNSSKATEQLIAINPTCNNQRCNECKSWVKRHVFSTISPVLNSKTTSPLNMCLESWWVKHLRVDGVTQWVMGSIH